MNWDMTWSGLGEPTPRLELQRYDLHAWPSDDIAPLAFSSLTSPALDVIKRRQTRRAFGPLSDASLSALLAAIAACRQAVDSPMGFALQQRGSPSAGAIHPVHILVCKPSSGAWHRYDGRAHAFQSLGTAPPDLLAACASAMPYQQGLLLFFVAEPGMTAAKYDDAMSLVLRDAGVLQGCAAIAAEALHLNFCLLGMTGDPWIAGLSQQGKLRGVGAALVGSRS